MFRSGTLSFFRAKMKRRRPEHPDHNIGKTNLFHTLESENPTCSHDLASGEALVSLVTPHQNSTLAYVPQLTSCIGSAWIFTLKTDKYFMCECLSREYQIVTML